MASIAISASISIPDSEVSESFIRSSGPGGQNVQKVETAVQLRFDVRSSPSLPDDVRARLETLARRWLTKTGEIVLTAQRFRTRERNREDALNRLVAMIREAARPGPPKRRPTRPTLGSRKRRLEQKKMKAETKVFRRSASGADD